MTSNVYILPSTTQTKYIDMVQYSDDTKLSQSLISTAAQLLFQPFV